MFCIKKFDLKDFKTKNEILKIHGIYQIISLYATKLSVSIPQYVSLDFSDLQKHVCKCDTPC